ncbi:DUF5615 family PIN-like protein [Bradyrhizobium commune]|uniref:DUF5615 family PIN-like protein n=1 Tax=Bradyrhizobium commune TaxID=83627 RepID=A0A7S9H2N4_9BRAD|nr:DUF5615 family PIN-like protein [Bradyrhizobium commune]
MLYLIDAQLPPALAEAMRRVGHDAAHVAELGMANADRRGHLERSHFSIGRSCDQGPRLLTLARSKAARADCAVGPSRQHRQSGVGP